ASASRFSGGRSIISGGAGEPLLAGLPAAGIAPLLLVLSAAGLATTAGFFAAAGEAGRDDNAGTTTTVWHTGHLIFLPARWSFTLNVFLQLSHLTRIGMMGFLM